MGRGDRLAFVALMLAAASLLGCESTDLRPAIVAVFGAAPATLDLPELGSGAEAMALLARPVSRTDLEENLVDDADRVWLDLGVSDSAHEVDLVLDDRVYRADSDDTPELAYGAGGVYRLNATLDGEDRSVEATAPDPPILLGLPAPGAHPAGAALVLDLSDQGFDAIQWVVMDIEGEPTDDGRPESTGDLLDWLIEEGEPVTTLEIPGEAFPEPDAYYSVAVFGMVRAPDDAFEGFNSGFGVFGLGSFSARPLQTAP
jgi:hypothetical protein